MSNPTKIASAYLMRTARDIKILPVRLLRRKGLTEFQFSSKWGDFSVHFSHARPRPGDHDQTRIKGYAYFKSERFVFLKKVYTDLSSHLESSNVLDPENWFASSVYGKNETDGVSLISKGATPGLRAVIESLVASALKDMVQDLLVDSDTSQLKSKKERLERELEELGEKIEETKRELAEVTAQLRNRNTSF